MSANTKRSLQQWLSWMETLHPTEIELGLTRIKTVADRLHINPSSSNVILVAGTNGKGSFITVMQQLLMATGARVGAYTSPHLQVYNERITINGVQVSDEQLCDAFETIDDVRGDISLTYFEFGTLAAFLIFQASDVDYWLCEVGLGGRLDAVNIIEPNISVITSIDLDHQQWLGDSREKIAVEKLGIVRKGGRCVFAESNPPDNVAEIFEQLNISPQKINEHFSIKQCDKKWVLSVTNNRKESCEFDCVSITLPPASVIAAVQTFVQCEPHFPFIQIAALLPHIKMRGRFQCEQFDGVPIVLDVAHNPAAGQLLADSVDKHLNNIASDVDANDKSEPAEAPKVFAVVGMMADKDMLGTLGPLKPFISHWCVTPIENMQRAATPEKLVKTLIELGVDVHQIDIFANPQASFLAAVESAKQAPKNSMVLCFGSFFTLAPILDMLDAHQLV